MARIHYTSKMILLFLDGDGHDWPEILTWMAKEYTPEWCVRKAIQSGVHSNRNLLEMQDEGKRVGTRDILNYMLEKKYLERADESYILGGEVKRILRSNGKVEKAFVTELLKDIRNLLARGAYLSFNLNDQKETTGEIFQQPKAEP